nr:hypothetical protein [Tanacetum cinerariifolium]
MKLVTKKELTSIAPFRMKGKSTPCFCLFQKAKSGYGPGDSPVYLNVYDLTPMNGYAYWAGLGIFHSGVEVNGVEYAYFRLKHDNAQDSVLGGKQIPRWVNRLAKLVSIKGLLKALGVEMIQNRGAEQPVI